MREETYDMDRITGKSKMWNKTGTLISVRNYKNGVPNGKAINYDNKGNALNVMTYKNRIRVD